MKTALALCVLAGCAAHAPAVPTPPPGPAAEVPAPTVVPASAPAATAPAPLGAPAPRLSDAELAQSLAQRCTACHSLAYVEQQRMSAAQWTGTLTKMRTWGALLDESEIPLLAASLAGRRGPTAALPEVAPREITAFVPPPVRRPSAQSLQRGKALFAARCVACHGPTGQGGVGVNLGDEQVLQEPAAFAATVRAGRGLMPPHPDLADAQLADLRAWLETL